MPLYILAQLIICSPGCAVYDHRNPCVWYPLCLLYHAVEEGLVLSNCSPVLVSFQAHKQTLHKELERQLSEKDNEIAILTSENEVGQTYTWLHIPGLLDATGRTHACQEPNLGTVGNCYHFWQKFGSEIMAARLWLVALV